MFERRGVRGARVPVRACLRVHASVRVGMWNGAGAGTGAGRGQGRDGAGRCYVEIMKASACAGLCWLGLSSSSCMPIRICDGPTVATLHGVRRHALYGARRLWCSSEQHCNVAVTVLWGYVVWDYSMGLHGAAWSCDGTASSLRAGRTSGCLMLMPGFHASSSFKMDKHTVPDGYTFGWNSGGTNLPSKVAKRDKQASKQASKQTNKNPSPH